MPHADSSLIPENITAKAEFWDHVYMQLEALLDGQTNWVTNLANASSLIYHSLLAFPAHFGPAEDKAVNWCGFYLDERLFPKPKSEELSVLLLGPFCGKPACQFIPVRPGKAKGVCAGAFIKQETLLVPDVEAYPGHIACDGDTKSEIVVPLISDGRPLGVLDLDCLALGGFNEEDKQGLEKIGDLIVKACEW